MHVYCLDIQSSQFSLAIKFQVLSRSKGHQPGYSMHNFGTKKHIKYVLIWRSTKLGKNSFDIILKCVYYSVGIKLIVNCQRSDWSWLVDVGNDIPDSMLCWTNFLVLHTTTCGYFCTHQQVGQSNTMKEHTHVSATYFPKQK